METEKMNILVVEDNPGDARLLKEAFKRGQEEEFNLVHAPGLQTAFKRLLENKVDIILLDLTLPGTSGLETLKKVHAKETKTPIIVLTGLNDEETALQALHLGAQGYFCKDPMGRNALARTLRYAAERRRSNPGEKGTAYDLEGLSSPGLGKISVVSLEKLSEYFDDVIISDENDLHHLLENEKMEVYFQPWVCLSEKSIVGLQGICEGKDGEREDLLSPLALMKMVSFLRFSPALNRLLRRQLLENFLPIYRQYPQLVLGVTFDAAGEDGDEANLNHFLSTVRSVGLNPSRIMVDILETQPCPVDRLRKFLERVRETGFLAALDGNRLIHANLDMENDCRPDLVKAGRPFVADIEKSFFKQETFRSLVKLSHGLGAQVLAQGVETEAEAMKVLSLGADFLQGGFLFQPQFKVDKLEESLEGRIAQVYEKFRNYMEVNLKVKKSCYGEYAEALFGLKRELSTVAPEAFEIVLFDLIQHHPRFESLTVLDGEGRQVCRVAGAEAAANVRRPVFLKPPGPGTDHSMMDYFYGLMERRDKEATFFTDPYLSRETRKLCVTISTIFKDASGEMHVLCADVKPERLLIQS